MFKVIIIINSEPYCTHIIHNDSVVQVTPRVFCMEGKRSSTNIIRSTIYVDYFCLTMSFCLSTFLAELRPPYKMQGISQSPDDSGNEGCRWFKVAGPVCGHSSVQKYVRGSPICTSEGSPLTLDCLYHRLLKRSVVCTTCGVQVFVEKAMSCQGFRRLLSTKIAIIKLTDQHEMSFC